VDRNIFEDLDALYTQLCPTHRTGKRPAELEPDAPAKVRQLWEATGVSEATGRFRTRAQSEEDLAKTFRDWAAAPVNRSVWGPDEAAFRRALPDRIRLLRVGTSGVAVSDETGTQDDPPVLLMRPNKRPLVRYHDRCTEWEIWRGVGIAASIREARYYPTGAIDGQPILKDAYPPGLYAMADRIWWVHMPPFPKEAEVPANSRPLIYASAREYLEYLLKLPVEKQGLFTMPKSSVFEVTEPDPIDLSKAPPKGFRVSNRADARRPVTGWFQAIGPVGDTLVWLLMREKGDLTVGFDPAARDEVRAWLEGLGVKISREQPLETTKPALSGW
jgi:hypothetical protein